MKIDLSLFTLSMNAAPSAMFLVNAEGKILHANPEAQDLFGYTLEEFKGMEIKSLMPEEVRDENQDEPKIAVDETGELSKVAKHTYPVIRKDKKRVLAEIKVTPIEIEGVHYVVFGLIDLTEQKATEGVIREQANQLAKANRRLSYQASTDSLTGLVNRREMMMRLEAILVDATLKEISTSLIMIDIDHFKAYNDEFGHLAGDDLLRRFADLLQMNARDEDVVARYGGEEFVLMFSGGEEQAVAIAERLCQTIQQKVWPLRHVTASLGVMTIFPHKQPGDIDTLMTELIDYADQAMYHSKATGRNRVTSYTILEEAGE